MAPHLDQQLREHIVSWQFDDEKPAREIASLANCSEATVYNVLRLYGMFGTVSNPYHQQ
jgi:IS30 family transposase